MVSTQQAFTLLYKRFSLNAWWNCTLAQTILMGSTLLARGSQIMWHYVTEDRKAISHKKNYYTEACANLKTTKTFPKLRWKRCYLCAVSLTACLVGAYFALASVSALKEHQKASKEGRYLRVLRIHSLQWRMVNDSDRWCYSVNDTGIFKLGR